ncbi:NAD(P)-dependent oxidoreductase [Aetokthonos hydrillicola Thurmond2011]|uniref:NAD(P)-dependent oxidoreductase n=1 Tax=Aetokthonos hydrillicola Thurmond2011 TaxID=2712845 RepID=A0AAP5MDI5_9CYAN|nr:NAD(P)-dependent oxidoreductase [Aetokthonos hydrillicola]MBO3458058.1 NAD(P)-dependent oxidoreductase [Aetokthonos hydrillicola CCALA 1050]MBW4587107.1 NAD(P)-dependent oxidoreductase [Aetokthonos hydrillicola CCALA 1050]MDR9899643.1 NAD(P)-dependent oxidoreductase [Aetokthonos hydrillicola Thurmond2011]
MNQKRILVTGASGCIGHYLAEALIQETNHDLYLLVRNPSKLQIDTQVRSGVTVLQGDMQEISRFSDLLKTVDIAVLTATAWGGTQTFDINVGKTLELLELLHPNRCEQVIYFSTASVLGNNNQPLKEAGEIGHDYVRSKYDCLHRMSKLAIAPKITTVFPTIVLGGDRNKPYSAVTSGIPDVTKYIDLIRFFKADGSFHFIHARDIATVVRHLIEHPPQSDEPHHLVLGQAQVTANQVIEEICAYLGKKIYFRIPLSLSIANLIIFLFRIQMAEWDRFCMNYRHFTYQNVVNPASFGLLNYCVTITDVLKICGVKGNSKIKINHFPSKPTP